MDAAMLAPNGNTAISDWTREHPYPRNDNVHPGDDRIWDIYKVAGGYDRAAQALWSHPNAAASLRQPPTSRVRSLGQIAARTAARQLEQNVTEGEDFLEVPLDDCLSKIIIQICEELQDPRCLSLEQWKTFRSAFKDYLGYDGSRRKRPPRKTVNVGPDGQFVVEVKTVEEPTQDAASTYKPLNWEILVALTVLDSENPNNAEEARFRPPRVEKILTEMGQHFATRAEQYRLHTLHHFYNLIAKPDQALRTYLEPLQPSTAFEFITHIQIAGPCKFTSQEMDALPKMQNLGVLEIIEPTRAEDRKDFPRVTNSTLNAWSSMRNPFPKLLVLKIRTRKDFTYKSLRHVAKFPSLILFKVISFCDGWSKFHNCLDSNIPSQFLDGWRECGSDDISGCNNLQWGYLAHTQLQGRASTMACHTPECRAALDACMEPKCSLTDVLSTERLDLHDSLPIISLGLGHDSYAAHTPQLFKVDDPERSTSDWAKLRGQSYWRFSKLSDCLGAQAEKFSTRDPRDLYKSDLENLFYPSKKSWDRE